MPSIFPAIIFAGNGDPIPELNSSFSPWDDDDDDFSSLFNPIPTLPKPGSSKPHVDFHSSFGSPAPGSHEPSREGPVSIIEERKRKRKLSNRESARRSRTRKLKHVEGLVSHVTQLKSENRELTTRFRAVNHHLLFTTRENQRLLDESVTLRRRLTHASQILHFLQLQEYPVQY